ncbi:hypothetical protein KDL44_15965 [bacterium]|nr:hypothetical protein [bacterium]
MAIYKLLQNEIVPMERTTFGLQGIRERQDLQNLLKHQINIIAPETLVVAEEFADWEDSKRRIDLLAIDREANLIVIELKRTEDGGHMELQAVRYAAMVSTLTFEKLAEAYGKYLADNDIEKDATEELLAFLGWDEPDDDQFAQQVKIILASAEFSRELTTAVMWLMDFGLDIRCVRMRPYTLDSETYLDVQTVIPLPEVADYQVRIREKKQKERKSRENSKDNSTYELHVSGVEFPSLKKRWLMFHIVAGLVNRGIHPAEIEESVNHVKRSIFESLDGILDEQAVQDALMRESGNAKFPRYKRFFSEAGQIFHVKNRTYVLTNQWGDKTIEAANALAESFPAANIRFEVAVN